MVCHAALLNLTSGIVGVKEIVTALVDILLRPL
jgi:hypothetical protein